VVIFDSYYTCCTCSMLWCLFSQEMNIKQIETETESIILYTSLWSYVILHGQWYVQLLLTDYVYGNVVESAVVLMCVRWVSTNIFCLLICGFLTLGADAIFIDQKYVISLICVPLFWGVVWLITPIRPHYLTPCEWLYSTEDVIKSEVKQEERTHMYSLSWIPETALTSNSKRT